MLLYESMRIRGKKNTGNDSTSAYNGGWGRWEKSEGLKGEGPISYDTQMSGTGEWNKAPPA